MIHISDSRNCCVLSPHAYIEHLEQELRHDRQQQGVYGIRGVCMVIRLISSSRGWGDGCWRGAFETEYKNWMSKKTTTGCKRDRLLVCTWEKAPNITSKSVGMRWRSL